MSNPFLNMSANERAKQFDLLQQAMKADECARLIVASAALKWSVRLLKDAGQLPEAFASIPQQAFPREANLAKPAGLSETQVHNLKDKAEAALSKIGL